MDEAEHKELGIETFNTCWSYLDKGELSSEEEVELVTTAFTSKYHWSFTGGAEQWAMSDWMVSRATAAIGDGALAVLFARRAFDATSLFEPSDWLMASFAEGMARAYACNGDRIERDEWLVTAERLVSEIHDPEDRELIASQLASVPR